MPLPRLQLFRFPDLSSKPLGSSFVSNIHVNTWQVRDLESHTFEQSFEVVSDELSRLPRLFIEPDGSFFWSGSRPSQETWQLYGMIYDRENRVVRVDLTGECPRSQWLELLNRLLPSGELIAYLIEPQCFVLARELANILID